MCFNEAASWSAFAIGSALSIFNLLKYRQAPQIITTLYWAQPILMQLLEALAYRGVDCKRITTAAFLLNVAQPLLLLCVLYLFRVGSLLLPTIAVALYLLHVFTTVSVRDLKCILVDGKTRLTWWSDEKGVSLRIISYLLASVVTLAAIPKYGATNVHTLILSFVLSWAVYEGQNVGSVWCFFSSFVPVAFSLMF